MTEPREIMVAEHVGPVLVFDLSQEPHALTPDEWAPRQERDPSAMLGVVLHAWGVRSVGTTAKNRRRFGEPHALARRGLATPYTINAGVTRAGVPVVGVCHPVERYTFASDAGNARYLSIGIMGSFAFEARTTNAEVHTPVTSALQAAVSVALDVAADLLGAAGVHAPTLLSHRQCANGPKDHFACPGEEAIRMALASPAVRHFTIDPDFLPPGATHGKAWPAAWRRHLSKREIEADLPRPVPLGDGALAGDVRPSPGVALTCSEIATDELPAVART